jgi:hypothetical protein
MKILKTLAAIIFVTFIFFACKKTDVSKPNMNENESLLSIAKITLQPLMTKEDYANIDFENSNTIKIKNEEKIIILGSKSNKNKNLYFKKGLDNTFTYNWAEIKNYSEVNKRINADIVRTSIDNKVLGISKIVDNYGIKNVNSQIQSDVSDVPVVIHCYLNTGISWSTWYNLSFLLNVEEGSNNGQNPYYINLPYGASGGGASNTPTATKTYNELWFDNHIKDSTNNPCDSLVLKTISDLDSSLPSLFRDIFGANAEINITYKRSQQKEGQGASTIENYFTNDFTTSLNSRYGDANTLSRAATILHESIHANLMYLYQKAVKQNDLSSKLQIENDFGLFFDSASIAKNPNLNYADLVKDQIGQHQIMSLNLVRTAMANTLLKFAKSLDASTSVDIEYCKKMAWVGTADSKGYKRLSDDYKFEIYQITEGERNSLDQADQLNFNKLGKSCQ